MKQDNELLELNNLSSNWINKNIKFYRMDDRTIEVQTPLIDSFGQNIYCFIETIENGYRITEGGWLLFKLDPEQSDFEFIAAASEIAIGSGFDFDEKTNEIYQEVTKKEIPQYLNNLAQLQVAISFLK